MPTVPMPKRLSRKRPLPTLPNEILINVVDQTLKAAYKNLVEQSPPQSPRIFKSVNSSHKLTSSVYHDQAICLASIGGLFLERALKQTARYDDYLNDHWASCRKEHEARTKECVVQVPPQDPSLELSRTCGKKKACLRGQCCHCLETWLRERWAWALSDAMRRTMSKVIHRK